MLTKESSRGFSPMNQYPTYEYRSKKGNRIRANFGGSRIVPTPKGYREVIRYQTVDEDFTSYLERIEDEHKGIPNERMIENSFGTFIGTWRNVRWYDEAQRRGIVKEVQ